MPPELDLPRFDAEAILVALRFQLKRLGKPWPLLERLKPVLERADALGPGGPDFDMKAYLDERWGGEDQGGSRYRLRQPTQP